MAHPDMPDALQGVLLSRMPYGDHDLILSVLTRDMGRLSVYAHRPRSKRKGWHPLLSPGNTLALGLNPKKRGDMESLVHLDLLRDRSSIMIDPSVLARAAYFLDMARASTRDGMAAPALLRALEVALDALDQDQTSRWMELQVIRHLGVEPDVHQCSRCQAALAEGAALETTGYGLVCRLCVPVGRHYPRAVLDRLHDLAETVVPQGGTSDHELGVLLGRIVRSQLGVLKSARVAAALQR